MIPLPQGSNVLVSGSIEWASPPDVFFHSVSILERAESSSTFTIILEGADLRGDLVRAELEYTGETEWTPIVSTWTSGEWVLEVDEAIDETGEAYA